jgi:predicted lipoprotein with Yx(FWY)xxD motif
VVADGGTWLLVSAAATKAATSAVEPLVQSANEPSYPSVLVNSHSDSLYLLSTEVGGTLMCTGGCTAVWLPLIVSSTTTSVAHLANVKGTIGFVARSKTTDQVTVNSYPVYTYVGDSGPGSVNGEGVVAYGGTWYLLNAGATKSSTTPVTPVTSGPGWSRRP